MANYTLKVYDKREETKDTYTIIFKQPGLKKVKYIAGQYITLIFRINGRRYMRPYSFSSAPDIDSHLEITVKRIPNGIVSNHICDVVKIGDAIEAIGPFGDFTLDKLSVDSNSNRIIFWGAGSGITPLFSIIKYILKFRQGCKVILFYGNRNLESVIFRDQLEKLQLEFPENFLIHYFYTQLVVEESQPFLIRGRINANVAIEIMNRIDNISKSFHYICGPIGLKESVKSALECLDINPDNIFIEDYELAKNEKHFEDISTRSVKIIKDDTVFTLEVIKGKSILETALDAMIELDYSCQTGNCSMCKGKIINGKVKQIITKHNDLLEDEYQLCCSYPLTDDVEVLV